MSLRARFPSGRVACSDSYLILSTPNVAFLPVRLAHLFGRVGTSERGILDVAHKRLFSRSSLLAMLRHCGYDVDRCVPVGAPFARLFSGAGGHWLNRLATWLAWIWPGGLAFQFVVICRPRPTVRQLLANATIFSRPSSEELVN